MFIKYSSRPLYCEIDGREFLRATAHCKDEWNNYDFRNPRLSYQKGKFPFSKKVGDIKMIMNDIHTRYTRFDYIRGKNVHTLKEEEYELFFNNKFK